MSIFFFPHQELFVHVTKGSPWRVTTKRVMTLTNVRNLVHAANNALIRKAHILVDVLRVTNWSMTGSIAKLQVRESCLYGQGNLNILLTRIFFLSLQ